MNYKDFINDDLIYYSKKDTVKLIYAILLTLFVFNVVILIGVIIVWWLKFNSSAILIFCMLIFNVIISIVSNIFWYFNNRIIITEHKILFFNIFGQIAEQIYIMNSGFDFKIGKFYIIFQDALKKKMYVCFERNEYEIIENLGALTNIKLTPEEIRLQSSDRNIKKDLTRIILANFAILVLIIVFPII